ncbi:septation ring formation regulator EzrA [Ignavigranum ruoffiae]|uniref:septation ring formation regulator EzrA n=1 Tax=Ignavigranum ruoffiae TaxID=89093 RepID=UPI0024ACCF1C|nr:septation ring formation regulator EzrA [Ignavigranum ruoffiae]
MSLTFTDILFILVILFVVVLGIIYYLKTQRNKEITELEERKEAMMSVSVADQLFTLKNMDLAGQTKRKYESLVASWQTMTNFKFTEIEAALVGAEQYTEQMNLGRAKRALDEAREMLDETESAVYELHEELTALLELPETNHERHEGFLDRYNKARKNVMNHSFDYGPAIETLEKNLQYMELNFTRYNEVTTEGDHIEAEAMLDQIETEISTLEDILEKIPKMYEKIKDDYEDALDDLKDGYQQMLDQHFNFENHHVIEDIDEIREKLNEAKSEIKNADLADAQILMDKSQREINALYEYLESEIQAKDYVNKHLNQLKAQIEAVMEHNRYAGIEVDRIAQSYLLHENEVDQINELTDQISAEHRKYLDLDNSLVERDAVYSNVAEMIRKIGQRLSDIDEKQQAIIARLGELNKREKEAKSNLDLYELDMRNMKRRLEKQHLPGLPESYYSKFYNVTDQIEFLSQQLNRVRIDMNEIEQIADKLENDLSELEETTEQIVDASALTEYMIQHSNRFRYDVPEMDRAIRDAEHYFYDEFRYPEALNVIEKVLRRVDPDGPTQVRRMYHQEKQSRL